MMRCIIVDDEPLVRELMEDNVRQVPFLELAAACKSATEAARVLQEEQIDLVFLDIRLPRISGLQFLETLREPPLVIIVSAYAQYALEGFSHQVADYLLKPVSFERFLKACNRAYELFRLKKGVNPTAEKPLDFFVNVEYTLVKIVVADIEYVEGLKDYIKIYLSSSPKPVLTRMTMKAMEERLPERAFIRIHKSYLVAVSKITTIKRDYVCIGKTEIPLSESYKENINRVLGRGDR